MKLDGCEGNLILLPYLDFRGYDADHDEGAEGTEWSEHAVRLSRKIVGQLLAVDKALRDKGGKTPAPDWLTAMPKPQKLNELDSIIAAISDEIASLNEKKRVVDECRVELIELSDLLFETGPRLEAAIERALIILGYKVDNFRSGDLEIDHIIISPEGFRMIGESEGKDSNAIDISKFRQLESNINEDFQREEINTPAKGVLFGNGFRFIEPPTRPEQFTAKCFTNAKRLGTALVRTSDLYSAALHALNYPHDEKFKSLCRESIEKTSGYTVQFPPGEQ